MACAANASPCVRPGDEAGLTDAMRTMSRDTAARDRMGRVARERAAVLSWPKGAASALAALREAAA